MSALTLRSRAGSPVTIDHDTVSELDASIAGERITPGDPGYDEARSVWNGMIDRRPGMIIQCRDAGDVARAVAFAREHDLLLAVKGAGHNIAGSGVCDGGLVIDFAEMRAVDVDPEGRIARVQPGCTLGELDKATQAFGLAVPTGINSTTGIAGLTLGGGFGWISRKHGMTVDSLISAKVVMADGQMVTASQEENADLFWAIRGGGGNFGIVTSFEFRLHPIGPEVLSGLIVHPFDDAPSLMRAYRDIVADSPDELSVWLVLRKAPPLPFLPEEWHGKLVLVMAALYAGDIDAGQEALKPIRSLGSPIADVIQPNPFTGWQQAFDPLLTPGARNYWKSHDFLELSDGLIDTLVEFVQQLPSDETECFVGQLGGAVNRVPSDATAYPHRDVEFIVNVHTRWQKPQQDESCVRWARDLFHAMGPYATGGVYVNFMPEDETHRTGGAYGGNLQRLSELKGRFDPTNLFQTNQNIPPARTGG
jgi:FAD/FMN-containing dehydrogenase